MFLAFHPASKEHHHSLRGRQRKPTSPLDTERRSRIGASFFTAPRQVALCSPTFSCTSLPINERITPIRKRLGPPLCWENNDHFSRCSRSEKPTADSSSVSSCLATRPTAALSHTNNLVVATLLRELPCPGLPTTLLEFIPPCRGPYSRTAR